MLSIGEFSKVSGLSVKTLRFYQEEKILMPSQVDPESGYRRYAESKIERARAIAFLRELEVPLDEIREILQQEDDAQRVLELLERRAAAIDARIRALRKASGSLRQFIADERRGLGAMATEKFEIDEKTVPNLLMAGVRMKGKHSDCGSGFSKIGKAMGRYICGPCFLLHYDDEHKEDGADFEACMPVSKAVAPDGISVRELRGGRCVSLIHKGPYDQLGRSYARILAHVNGLGWKVEMPTREIYVKGPGMIFKGNPNKYLTEIQFFKT